MSFLSALPIIGSLFESIGNAIDRNVTTDEERLRLKADLTTLYVPLLTAVVDAQKHATEMQVRLAEVEARSEHWLVWARRPILSLLAFVNAIYAGVAVSQGWPAMDAESAVTLALLANGLDMGTRGVEKMVRALREKERI